MIGGRPGNLNWSLLNSKCIVVIGSNLTEEQNVLGVPIKQALSKGSKLLVIDQRETELTRYADIWVRPRVGTDATIIGAMMRTIVDESLEDHDFITERCDNFDDLRGSLWDFDLSKVERTTGIDQDTIRKAARMVATSGPVSFLYGLETLELSHQDNFVASIINLCLLTGNIEKPSTGIYPLFAGANERGAKDMGCIPTQSSNESSEGLDGIGFINMGDALTSNKIKALHLIGDSPNYHNGYHDDFIQVLDNVEFTILQDSVSSELIELADVVFPSAAFSEKDGTYTNMEGRIQAIQQAMGPKGDEDEDWHILSQLAQRMGNTEFDYPNSASVFQEIKNSVLKYEGVDRKKIFSGDEFVSSDPIKRFRFSPITFISETHMSLEGGKYPLLLAPGRVLQDPDRDAGIETQEDMYKITRNGIVEISEPDAVSIGASEGDLVNVTGKNFEFTAIAHVNGIHQGMVASTALFGSLIESMSKSEQPDPVIGLKSLVLSPVKVAKLTDSRKE
jgi:predicted molibdopterin-dependent oxidoreductase YjgC